MFTQFPRVSGEIKSAFQKRFIHSPLYFPKNKVNHLVIVGHNSMLFTALDSINHHRRERYPDITYVYPSFWLDGIHSDYDNLDWGQTIYGLPKSVRQRFLKQRPHYPEDRYIKWREFQMLREEARKELREIPGVRIYEKDPVSIELQNKEWFIDLGDIKPSVPKDSFFYGWYRKPYMPQGMEKVRPHTQIYTLPRNLVPNPMIVVGHGLSIVWLLKHFPDHKIINIKRAEEVLPEIPANSDVNVQAELDKGRLVVHTTDEVHLIADAEWKKGTILSSRTGKQLVENDIAIYMATGLTPEHSVFRKIPENQKVLLPIFKNGELSAPLDEVTIKLDKDSFISSKNVPMGSLAQNYVYLMNLTSNIEWTAEPMFYYRSSQYELLKLQAKELGIEINLDYFERLDKEIECLDNPLNMLRTKALYLKVFKDLYRPTSIEIVEFQECLQKLFKFEDDFSLKNIPVSHLKRSA